MLHYIEHPMSVATMHHFKLTIREQDVNFYPSCPASAFYSIESKQTTGRVMAF